MIKPQSYVSVMHWIVALQWTGDNLRAVQEFVAPQSPSYAPDQTLLTVRVPDQASTEKYPTLGAQYKQAIVPLHAWLIRAENGDLTVLTAKEFEARYAVVEEPRFVAHEAPAGDWPVAAFPLGAPIVATHPRVVEVGDKLVDRQPEVDAVGDVTER